MNRLTEIQKLDKGRSVYRCTCGAEKVIMRKSVNRGLTRSCGCFLQESRRTACLTHGASRTPLYRVYAAMKERCTSPACKDYQHYGGRGITVCDRWLQSFESFLADMGPRPRNHTLERLDNNKGYHPDNCAWKTMTRQCRNRRDTRMLEFRGTTKALADWADEIGLKVNTLRGRILRSNWSVEKALTTPV